MTLGVDRDGRGTSFHGDDRGSPREIERFNDGLERAAGGSGEVWFFWGKEFARDYFWNVNFSSLFLLSLVSPNVDP